MESYRICTEPIVQLEQLSGVLFSILECTKLDLWSHCDIYGMSQSITFHTIECTFDICLNCKMHLSKLQNIFVLIAKCTKLDLWSHCDIYCVSQSITFHTIECTLYLQNYFDTLILLPCEFRRSKGYFVFLYENIIWMPSLVTGCLKAMKFKVA